MTCESVVLVECRNKNVVLWSVHQQRLMWLLVGRGDSITGIQWAEEFRCWQWGRWRTHVRGRKWAGKHDRTFKTLKLVVSPHMLHVNAVCKSFTSYRISCIRHLQYLWCLCLTTATFHLLASLAASLTSFRELRPLLLVLGKQDSLLICHPLRGIEIFKIYPCIFTRIPIFITL